jgi:hypothetical protein
MGAVDYDGWLGSGFEAIEAIDAAFTVEYCGQLHPFFSNDW